MSRDRPGVLSAITSGRVTSSEVLPVCSLLPVSGSDVLELGASILIVIFGVMLACTFMLAFMPSRFCP